MALKAKSAFLNWHMARPSPLFLLRMNFVTGVSDLCHLHTGLQRQAEYEATIVEHLKVTVGAKRDGIPA